MEKCLGGPFIRGCNYRTSWVLCAVSAYESCTDFHLEEGGPYEVFALVMIQPVDGLCETLHCSRETSPGRESSTPANRQAPCRRPRDRRTGTFASSRLVKEAHDRGFIHETSQHPVARVCLGRTCDINLQRLSKITILRATLKKAGLDTRFSSTR